MQFFKRRCSCGTWSPRQDISHECFKRNCGSNPTAGLNHLRAATSPRPTPDRLFLLVLAARERGFLFRPFLLFPPSLRDPSTYLPSRSFLLRFSCCSVTISFLSFLRFRCSFCARVPLVILHDFVLPCRDPSSLSFLSLLSEHVMIPDFLRGDARTTSPPNNIVTLPPL